MPLFTFDSLKLGARERADMVNSSFISDTEEERVVNESVQRLYDILITQSENWRINSFEFSVVVDRELYPLPDDFYRIRAVDEVLSTNQILPMKRFQFADRNIYQTLPVRALDVKLWYFPQQERLVAGTDTFEVPNGWERFVHLDAAMHYLTKEESDIQAIAAERGDLEQKIMSNSIIRDAYRPERIIDVHHLRAFNNLVYSETKYDLLGSDLVFYASDMEYVDWGYGP